MRFHDIIGHDAVKQRLRQMIDTDRLPHALLLEGPAGVGKFMLARAAVQYLHCTDRTDGDSCGRCPSCLQHESFNHIDTIYSFPVLKSAGGAVSDDFSSQWQKFLTDSPFMSFELWQKMLGKADGKPVIYVDESQDIIRKLSYTSHGADCKAVVMWLPEKMNEQCANKLLKLIEEPLPGVRLIFVSNSPREILPTIYSRLQRIEMRRLADAEIAAYLLDRYPGAAPQIPVVAANAAGSVLNADKMLAKSSELPEFLELYIRLMRLAYQRNVGLLKTWSVDVAGLGREKIGRFCDYCVNQTRENFIANIRIAALNCQTPEEASFTAKFSPFINEKNVEAITEVFTKARRDVMANGNSKIIFFDVAVKIILLLLKK